MGNERWAAEVDSRLARLELLADEAELADAHLGSRPGAAVTDEKAYPDLDSWVRDYFCTTFVRPLGGEYRWCVRWPEHREAVLRLDALWSSWNALTRDPHLGMSTWLHQFLDPQLTILLAPRGPFVSCSARRYEDTPVSLSGLG
ncbi:DUF4913 domain-containing protein [Quadrisphaera sp. INWT6]|uniref:DUF4913 domain-containing protein n=1 Tax=Quadrisphaera sp. INWT6 TaxID=2596917 RepID=UPI0035CD2ADF